jgi:hypothetical protein
MSVKQVSGPRVVGSGNVQDGRFSTTPTSLQKTDATGDARYPVPTGANVKQLDLRSVRLVPTASSLDVRVDVSSLSSMTSPSSGQGNVWWLVTWADAAGNLWFARAESDGGGALTFHAGKPSSYDRPGIAYYTIPTMVDYSGGTAITGERKGNSIVMHVPAALVGSPKKGSVLESASAWAALDNGLPLYVTVGPGNVPTVVDGTPAYNALLASAPGNPPASGRTSVRGRRAPLASTGGGLVTGLAACALMAAAVVLHRVRRLRSTD